MFAHLFVRALGNVSLHVGLQNILQVFQVLMVHTSHSLVHTFSTLITVWYMLGI